jgi:hypothetical protein
MPMSINPKQLKTTKNNLGHPQLDWGPRKPTCKVKKCH